jgi:hypothetical protein
MTVGDSFGYAHLIRQPQHDTAKEVHVAVQALERSFLANYPSERLAPRPDPIYLGVWNLKNSAAKPLDLSVVKRLLSTTDREIKLNSRVPDLAIDVHYRSLSSPAGHRSKDVQDPDHQTARALSSTGIKYSASVTLHAAAYADANPTAPHFEVDRYATKASTQDEIARIAKFLHRRPAAKRF